MKPGPKIDFWSKVDKDGPIHPIHGQCWMYTAAKDKDGRGIAWRNGRKTTAPRFAWEEANGPTPLWVLHHCDNPGCVRLDHLFVGTNDDNVADRQAKGRQSRGEVHGAHWRAKTHCPKGHPYDEKNTCWRKPTARQKVRRTCRACAREYSRRVAQLKRENQNQVSA